MGQSGQAARLGRESIAGSNPVTPTKQQNTWACGVICEHGASEIVRWKVEFLPGPPSVCGKMVIRSVWDRDIACSNHVTPTAARAAKGSDANAI